MSPERVRGLPVDERTDMFSFGVVLYEMVSRQRPFRGNSAVDVMDAILREPPRELDGLNVSGKLKALIRRLLEKEPGKRLASAGEVMGELRAVAASLEPARGRLPRGAWIAIGAAAMVIAGLAGWYWHRASRVQWALETATPEIARLVEAEEFVKAAALTRDARAFSPRIRRSRSSGCGRQTRPPSKPFLRGLTSRSGPTGEPGCLDESRQDAAREGSAAETTAEGHCVWRIAKPGFAHEPMRSLCRRLKFPSKFKAPCRGQRSAGWWSFRATEMGLGFRCRRPPVQLDDFLIDRYEVTNEEYKKFVDAGGYREARVLEAALREERPSDSVGERRWLIFEDATGRPGPATWEVGQLSERHGEAPGRRRQLVRGGSVRRVRGQEPSHGLPLDAGRRSGRGSPP